MMNEGAEASWEIKREDLLGLSLWAPSGQGLPWEGGGSPLTLPGPVPTPFSESSPQCPGSGGWQEPGSARGRRDELPAVVSTELATI